MAQTTAFVLPRDLVESQISMVELLTAMYPAPASMAEEIDSSLEVALERAREWCENSDQSPDRLPVSFDLTLTVPLEHGPSDESQSLQMSVSVPLRSSERESLEPPPITYTVRQPYWMSRADASRFGTELPLDDVVAAFDYVKENAHRFYTRDKGSLELPPNSNAAADSGPLLRVWFYFPSLSTREKRKDLVNYASRYDLTGFVLAGKPGVLCLEGTSKSVDDYMNAIKNESWGDIPSHQKKVSERFREDCGEAGRKFEGMREITDDLGERRGTRKNRGDMAALEAFLTEQGVGASFSKVIMGA